MEKRAGSTNFSVVDEWNTSKVCHRCFQPLMKVKVPVKEKRPKLQEEEPPPPNDEEQDPEGEENGTKRKASKKMMITLRGLQRCCSGKSNKINNVDCPIGGAFIDRDSNAATNIALKYIWNREPNPPNSFGNLMKNTRLNLPRSFFNLESQKESTLPTSTFSASCRLGTNEGVVSTSLGRYRPLAATISNCDR